MSLIRVSKFRFLVACWGLGALPLLMECDGSLDLSAESSLVTCKMAAQGAGWTGSSFPARNDTFQVDFDVTPSAAPLDAVVGLSLGNQATYAGQAALVRFNPSGAIDARNGPGYTAATLVPYAANVTYHVRLLIRVPLHTYSIRVSTAGGPEVLLGADYAFRASQAAVAGLDSWATYVETGPGALNVCGFSVTTPALCLAAVQAGPWKSAPYTLQSGGFTAEFDATPSAAPLDAVMGLSLGAQTAFAALSAMVRFNDLGTIDARNGGAYSVGTVRYSAMTSYHFRLAVDPAAHTYSAWVKAPGGGEQLLGADLAFRAIASSLDTIDVMVDPASPVGASVSLCGLTIAPLVVAPPPPPPLPRPMLPPGPAFTAHPRIFLDPPVLAALKARALAGAATWTTLRSACNSYLGGTVNYPDGAAYPNLPNIGAGYQGEDYVDPISNIGLCYQIGRQIGDPNTAQWGLKGVDLLEKLSNPLHVPAYSTDSGYGIRNYGKAMAMGYDWLYPVLSPVLMTQVYTQLNGWIAWFDAKGFGHDHPCGNYFAGYYAAKAYAAIATTGENPGAPAMWSDFLDRLHRGGANAIGTHTGVQSYFGSYMAGGGWSEGWQYGPGALVHMSLPALAALTATGLDLVNDPQRPYRYPIDSGAHLMHFTWPSLTTMDDRDTNHSGNDPQSFPSRPNINAITVVAGLLGRYNQAQAPSYHAYARAVRKQSGRSGTPWVDALFWDEAAPEVAYDQQPLSLKAAGLNSVAMRSDWTPTARWASLRASAYVNDVNSGEQYFDAGALAIVKGGTPFLVNATGFLVTSYPGTTVAWENHIYNELYGGMRGLFNTFANGASGQIAVPVDTKVAPTTRVSRFEDRGGYVLSRADGLADVYRGGVGAWSRTVVYFRPNLFVISDATTVPDLLGDQHMSWHLIFTPSPAAAPSVGALRYDVNNPTAGFVGAVTTLLPAAARNTLVNVFGSNKVYRLEVRPTVPAVNQGWLTVFDAAATSGQVALAQLVHSSNGDGALMVGATSSLAVFADKPAGAVTLSIPAATTRVVIANLTPGAGYSVTAPPSGGGGALAVSVQPVGAFVASANGTLYVNVSALGAVTPGS